MGKQNMELVLNVTGSLQNLALPGVKMHLLTLLVY